MHLRASLALGTPVIDDSTQQILGVVDQPCIDPDTGRVLGFFILSVFIGESELFLQSSDIASWGTRVHVLSADRLGPPNDFVRLQKRFQDPRTFLGQVIKAKETDKVLGTLDDIQFNTRTFAVEWIFPRKLFFLRSPLPVSDILEVTPEAVWVREPLRRVTKPLSEPIEAHLLPEVATPA